MSLSLHCQKGRELPGPLHGIYRIWKVYTGKAPYLCHSDIEGQLRLLQSITKRVPNVSLCPSDVAVLEEAGLFVCISRHMNGVDILVWIPAKPGFIHPNLQSEAAASNQIWLSPTGKWIKAQSWKRLYLPAREARSNEVNLDSTLEHSTVSTAYKQDLEFWSSRPDLRGVELPAHALLVEVLVPVADRTLTYSMALPSATFDADKNKSRSDHIRRMALAPTAFTDSKFIQLEADDEDLVGKINASLEQNAVVLVRGHRQTSKFLTWDDRRVFDIVRGPDDLVSVTPQSSLPRNQGSSNETLTFYDFLKAAGDVNRCSSLLETRPACANTPDSLLLIAQDQTALNVAAAYPLFPGQLGEPPLHVDGVVWFTLEHAGAYTPPHHDPAGRAAWTLLHDGVRLVSWRRPLSSDRLRLSESLKFVDQACTGADDTDLAAELFTVCLRPGDILIRPPNLVVSEYSAEKSIVQGGYFYSYHSMHLTEAAFRVGLGSAQASLQKLPSFGFRRLFQMAIALAAGRWPYLPIRCIQSLARIVLNSTQFEQALTTRLAQQTSETSQLVDDSTAPATSDAILLHRVAEAAAYNEDRSFAVAITEILLQQQGALSSLSDYDSSLVPWDAAGPCNTASLPFARLPLTQICDHVVGLSRNDSSSSTVPHHLFSNEENLSTCLLSVSVQPQRTTKKRAGEWSESELPVKRHCR
ncbi:hypothetical protein BKA62DRAFT_65413 [Auriculariales sp. MPI-PUGE-AT-0066]|nr:hypothetical protein BKA62DRAFT_65413 [Auriculariales sp. MPI-PUGE-AT-0066]